MVVSNLRLFTLAVALIGVDGERVTALPDGRELLMRAELIYENGLPVRGSSRAAGGRAYPISRAANGRGRHAALSARVLDARPGAPTSPRSACREARGRGARRRRNLAVQWHPRAPHPRGADPFSRSQHCPLSLPVRLPSSPFPQPPPSARSPSTRCARVVQSRPPTVTGRSARRTGATACGQDGAAGRAWAGAASCCVCSLP